MTSLLEIYTYTSWEIHRGGHNVHRYTSLGSLALLHRKSHFFNNKQCIASKYTERGRMNINITERQRNSCCKCAEALDRTKHEIRQGTMWPQLVRDYSGKAGSSKLTVNRYAQPASQSKHSPRGSSPWSTLGLRDHIKIRLAFVDWVVWSNSSKVRLLLSLTRVEGQLSFSFRRHLHLRYRIL